MKRIDAGQRVRNEVQQLYQDAIEAHHTHCAEWNRLQERIKLLRESCDFWWRIRSAAEQRRLAATYDNWQAYWESQRNLADHKRRWAIHKWNNACRYSDILLEREKELTQRMSMAGKAADAMVAKGEERGPKMKTDWRAGRHVVRFELVHASRASRAHAVENGAVVCGFRPHFKALVNVIRSGWSFTAIECFHCRRLVSVVKKDKQESGKKST